MSDFTFKDILTGILKFNDENVMHIGFDTDSEDIIITNWNAAAGTSKTLQTNMNGGGVPAGYINVDDIATHNISGIVNLSDSVTIIKDYAFYKTQITELHGHGVLTVEGHGVQNSPMTVLDLPELTTIENGGSNFADNGELTSISFPKLTTIKPSTYIFSNCSKLAVADLGFASGFANYIFNNCNALRTLILRKSDGICALSSSGLLGGISANPSESTVYVPEDLISTYENATNWSSLYASGLTFTKLEGSIYE